MKIPFITFADVGSLLEKIDTCHSNTEKSSATKINKHATSGHSIFRLFSFDATKSKHNYYRDLDCMKNFYKNLKEHAAKIINREKNGNDIINK